MCPEPDVLARFSQGQLGGSELTALEAHVGSCGACGRCVAAVLEESAGLEERCNSPLLQRGVTLGRYVLLEFLGAGGMGAVYSAFDPQLNRRVALKLLRRGYEAAAAGSSLQREAQAMARLSHPQVVTVHDVGTWNGRVFLAMELVDGHCLSVWLRQARRGWREVRDIFLQAGAGLAAAHRAGVIHRDFKPQNVLVGREGQVRVADFGLACGPDLGAGSGVAGTPRYMAPEQRAGQPASALSDQYSFCRALYEAWFDVPDGPLDGSLRTPSHRNGVPARLVRAVVRGMAVRPEDRHPSMDALLAALGDRPSGRGARWALGLAAAGLLVAVGGGRKAEPRCAAAGPAIWDPAREASARAAFLATELPYAGKSFEAVAAAIEAFSQRWSVLDRQSCEAGLLSRSPNGALARQRECLDARRAEVLAWTDLLQHADARAVERAAATAQAFSDLTACEDLDALLSLPDPPPGQRPALEAAQVELSQARALLGAGRFAEASAAAQRGREKAESVRFQPLEAQALFLQGSSQLEAGAVADAEPSLYRAAVAAELGRAWELETRAYLRLVELSAAPTGHILQGHLYLEHAQAASQRIPLSADLRAQLGYVSSQLSYFGDGDVHRAASQVAQALDWLTKAPGVNSYRVAGALSWLGAMLAESGRPEEARRRHQAAVELAAKDFGTSHPAWVKTMTNWGISELRWGDAAQGLAISRRGWEASGKVLGPRHPFTLSTAVAVAEGLLRVKRVSESVRAYEQALANLQAAYPSSAHPRVFEAMLGLGNALRTQGDPARAAQLHRRALSGLEGLLGPSHPSVADALFALAADELEVDPEGALARLQRALEIREKRGSPMELAKTRTELARAESLVAQRRRRP